MISFPGLEWAKRQRERFAGMNITYNTDMHVAEVRKF
jgi:hypothetical protein